MTCKDCIHFDLCEDWFEQIKQEGFVTGERSQNQCESFKNKKIFTEIIRCKDCKFWGASHNRCSVMSREIAQDGFVQTSGDFFCALAERKDKS